jgi:rhamnogalacturonyl hydrolase YesR
MIRFGEEVCTNLDAGLRREWVETNGIGGFASGTMNGCNSRRYSRRRDQAARRPIGSSVEAGRNSDR